VISSFQFKGKDLHPFSEGRRSVAQALGLHAFQGKPPTLFDMHAIIYLCISTPKRLSVAYREPDNFLAEVMEWADNNITPEDYESEAALVREIIENAFKTRAIPKRDDSLLSPDELDPNL